MSIIHCISIIIHITWQCSMHCDSQSPVSSLPCTINLTASLSGCTLVEGERRTWKVLPSEFSFYGPHGEWWLGEEKEEGRGWQSGCGYFWYNDYFHCLHKTANCFFFYRFAFNAGSTESISGELSRHSISKVQYKQLQRVRVGNPYQRTLWNKEKNYTLLDYVCV